MRSPRSFTDTAPPVLDGWLGGEPDLVIELPREVSIPAEGGDEYHYLLAPTGFTEERWVRSAEVRLGNRRVVHHATVMVFPSDMNEETPEGPRLRLRSARENNLTERVGRVLRLRADAPVTDDGCTLPGGGAWPGLPAHEVRSCHRFERAVRAVSFTAHMHYRGSAMSAEAIYPDGTVETVFSVPEYSFDWQTTYVLATPREIPAGTLLRTTALFDDSEANPRNPDPTQTVRWGEPSASEMMGLWVEYLDEP